MKNALLEDVEYKIQRTRFGIWRRYGYENGASFHEFKSNKYIIDLPLVHYTYGKNPETGCRIVAKGIVAIGRIACGFIAIGQASFGLVAIGQLAIGIVFGLGQLTTGIAAVGQFAIAALFGLGQFAAGYVAIGQVAAGKYALGQMGFGKYIWSTQRVDSEAVEFFKSLPVLRDILPNLAKSQ